MPAGTRDTATGHRRRVGIMQPYLFPYIGYFQLIASCDVFVFLDDAQYIKQGWVNRNRILVNGAAQWITLPVCADDHRLAINQRTYSPGKFRGQLLRRIEAAYRGAPGFTETFPVLREWLSWPESNVAGFNIHTLRQAAEWLGIATPLKTASEIRDPGSLACEHMVIDLCRHLGATHYVNPVAGAPLYPETTFRTAGIDLEFLEPGLRAYPQGTAAWHERLSIIDVLMFNGRHVAHDMVRHGTTLPAATFQGPGASS